MSRVPALVSTGWVLRCTAAPRMASAPLNHLRVLETSWEANSGGLDSYLKCHIPSAHHYDMKTGVNSTQLTPKYLPKPSLFQDYVRSLGINNDTHVVVYDKGPMFNAARLWFLFKLYGHNSVSVVDGGMSHWLQCKLPVDSGEPSEQLEEGDFTIRDENEGLLVHFEDMVNNINSKNKFQIVDVRNPDYFAGKLEEPSRATIAAVKSVDLEPPETMQRGHVPHAVNIENDHFIDPVTNCLTEKDDLKQLFTDRGIDTHKPLVSMCYNGVSACLIPLALAHMQNEASVGVYCGSWTEYGQRASKDQVETGNPHSFKAGAIGG